MAIYRKIDCRISNDKKFRELSVEGKLAWYTILSRRDLAPIGAFKASFESLAIEQRGNEYLNEGLHKGLPKAFSEVFIQALNELLSKGLIKYDSESFLIYVPNFLRYNFPENPNVVKSWNSALDSLPECDLTNHVLAKSAEIILNSQRDSFIKALPKEFVEAYQKGFAKALPKGFTKDFWKGMPKQEQEQEQEQDIYAHTEAKDEKTTLATDSQGRNIFDLKPNEIVPSELLSDYATARINSYLPEKKSEGKLPAPEQTEVVGTASAPSKPKTEEKPQSRGVATKTQTSVAKPDEVSNELWADFLNHRKQKKAPVTDRVISLIRNEAKNAGWTLEEALNEVILRNWIGFKAEWVEAKDPNAVWVKAEDYQPELPPVEYAPSARECFDRIMAKSTYAYDIKDLSQLERVVKKEAK
jgi:hypothetical protein|nr:MAG TPA: hypothetical protein [Caudoviricetes sp.]